MDELEAEKRITALVMDYCSETGVDYSTLHDFLFKHGNLYKMDNILEQVEIPVD